MKAVLEVHEAFNGLLNRIKMIGVNFATITSFDSNFRNTIVNFNLKKAERMLD